MQIKIGDIEIELVKTKYNKTIVQPDGITHLVDTDHDYYAYQFGMAKNYFDINSKEELIKALAEDLRYTADELEKQLEQAREDKELDR